MLSHWTNPLKHDHPKPQPDNSLQQYRLPTEGFYDTASPPKPESVATQNSLPKRNHVAKEAVSAAWQTKARRRSE
jgi:hypothetical protein